MEIRIEQLSSQAGESVDTIRYYQSKGLLDPPRREGRVAWYNSDHLQRIARIRSLQERGFTLATISRLMTGDLDPADEALIRALVGDLTGGVTEALTGDLTEDLTGAATRTLGIDPALGVESETTESEVFTVSELATRTGVPLALLKALEAEELLIPRRIGSVERYTHQDVDATEAGLLLLEWGIPLTALLELSRRHHAATEEVAREAVVMFSTHVRGKLRQDRDASLGGATTKATTEDDVSDEGAGRLVEAFLVLLPAITTLVDHHFTRTLLKAAFDHIEQVGTDVERQAVWEQVNQSLAPVEPVGP